MLAQLSPQLIIGIIVVYFLILIVISRVTAKTGDNETFFNAGKSSKWWMVAIGMIGASLSGVTFISIPGVVGKEGLNNGFSYLQTVMGYLLGYLVIATVLMPIYYRYNLTSIYTYLGKRLGKVSYKTGAGFFLLSRIVGASFRLYLVAIVLDLFVTGPIGLEFYQTVLITIILIWTYTNKGGIKTIVITDVFQTVSMLTAAVLTIYAITQALGHTIWEIPSVIADSDYSQVFFFESGWSDPNNFFKQFLSGAFITIAMTGLDQDMMQKNLTCRSLPEAQKNVFLFSIVLIAANIIFLSLGALMYMYIGEMNIAAPQSTDQLYPTLALQHLPSAVGIAFVIGLIAAAYSSADSALTSLTTSFCIDFLGFKANDKTNEAKNRRTRKLVHIGFSLILFAAIMIFNAVNDSSVINSLFKAAGYTYGPILGLFAFSIFTSRKVKDQYVLFLCLFSAVFSFVLDYRSEDWFDGFTFGFLILLLNGLITFLGLLSLSSPTTEANIK